MRFVFLILLFLSALTTSVWAEECKPLSSEAVSSPLGIMCKDSRGKTSESLEERIFFQYALHERMENMKCGSLLISKLSADPKYTDLANEIIKDTKAKAVILKKHKAERIELVRKIQKLQPSLHRDQIYELEQRKHELSALIEADYQSMYQGSTPQARVFAEQLASANLEDPKVKEEQTRKFLRMLGQIDGEMRKQLEEMKPLIGTEKVKESFPEELKRSLTKDLEIRASFENGFTEKNSASFAENLVCRLDQKYGYEKELQEGRRDGVLTAGAFAVPLGTGWSLAKYTASTGGKILRGAGWMRLGSAFSSAMMGALATSGKLGRACSEFSRDYKISQCNEENLKDFAVNSIGRQNCFLQGIAMAATVGMSVLPEVHLLRNSEFFKPRISSWTKEGYEAVRTSSQARLGEDLQSKIWNLQNTGKGAEAAALENKVRKTLQSSEIVSYRTVGEGVSGAKFVKFTDGTEGVWKPAEGVVANANAEVAVGLVDKHLGTKMVPITVERELNGVKGTVQLRVTNATDEALKDYPLEMGLFDYLIGNYDRHGLNYLFTNEGRVVAIDHGRAFIGARFQYKGMIAHDIENHQGIVNMKNQVLDKLKNLESGKSSGMDGVFSSKKALEEKLQALQKMEANSRAVLVNKVTAMTGDPAVIEKLRHTKPEDWQRLLGNRLSKDQHRELVQRQKDILEGVEMAEKYLGKDAFRSGPTSPLLFRDKNGVNDATKPR